jgi:hypothetical protein
MCRAVMAERSGESANDASDTVTIGTKRQQKSSTQHGKKFGEKDSTKGGPKTVGKAYSAEASSGTEGSGKAGTSGKGCSGSVGAGAVQVVQGRVVGNRGTHSERARHALRMPLLPEVAPSTWSGAGI